MPPRNCSSKLLRWCGSETSSASHGRRSLDAEFVPRNVDLRAIFLLAEAVGGYEAFNDLVNEHSSGHTISRDFGEKAR
jgi:hypothetical protein